MKQILLFLLIVLFSSCSKESDVLAEPTSRTLIVYYSYTGNVQAIVDESLKLTEADVVEIQPAEEGLKYEADNYALGSALIGAIRANPDDAGSYPEIKSVDIDFSQYDNIIVATPLWWSNMAAPMQTFLFHNGGKMAGKNIALIVSSASSGISSVVDDAHRLIPDGNFSDEALWINNSNRNNMPSLLGNWIKTLNFSDTMAQKLFITVGNATITATMVDNVATQALIAALKESPISYEASDYGDFEKVGPLGRSLPTANEQTTTQAGDIVLYNGNQIVIFYGSNSWSYTRIGKIDDISQEELKSVLGDGNCTITLSLSKDFSTGVQKVHGDADNAMKSSRSPMYDLQGHEITAPTNGQVYIQDGRKWLIQE